VKTAPATAPTVCLKDFEADIAKALDNEHTQVEQKLASEVWNI
jgi:hypothetical protein